MRLQLICACVLLSACASGGTFQRLDRAALASYDRRLLVADEVAHAEAGSAYDLIRRLRPEFLISRGPTSILLTSPDTPEVFVDGIRRGGIEELQYLPASDVYDVHFYPMSAVPVAFSGNHPAGVIVVRTRTR